MLTTIAVWGGGAQFDMLVTDFEYWLCCIGYIEVGDGYSLVTNIYVACFINSRYLHFSHFVDKLHDYVANIFQLSSK